LTVRAPFFTVSRFPLPEVWGTASPNLIASNHVPAHSEPIPSFTLNISPSISALTLKLEAVLKDAGIPAKRFAA